MDNLLIHEYSELLTSSFFYEKIKSTHLLIFQTDSFIFKQIPQKYFNYDYIGARWPDAKKPNNYGNYCGNGGFSLRKKTAMINACLNTKRKHHPEDIFFAHAKGLHLPDVNLQHNFSLETSNEERHKKISPIGCHKFMTKNLYKKTLPN